MLALYVEATNIVEDLKEQLDNLVATFDIDTKKENAIFSIIDDGLE